MPSGPRRNRNTSEKESSVSEHPGVDRFEILDVDNSQGCAAAVTPASSLTIPELLISASASCLTSPRSSETSEDERSVLEHPGIDRFEIPDGDSLQGCAAAAIPVASRTIPYVLNNACASSFRGDIRDMDEENGGSSSWVSVKLDGHQVMLVDWLCPPRIKRKQLRYGVSCDSILENDITTVSERMKQSKILVQYPVIANIASAQEVCKFVYKGDIMSVSELLYNKQCPPLIVDNAIHDLSSVTRDYSRFQSDYVAKMDESAGKLCNMAFRSVDDAQLVLCQMIRSFVPNLCAHYETSSGRGTVFWFECGSKGQKKKTSSESCSTLEGFEGGEDYFRSGKRRKKDNDCVCKWKARLRSFKTESNNTLYRFSDIDSFSEHKATCLSCSTRFTTVEVDFQSLLNPDSRAKVMSELKQYMVKENTFSVRRFREKVRMMNLIDSNSMKKLEEQEVDTDVTNLNINTEDRTIPEETMALLRYLSMIKKEDRALVKAVFMEEEGIDTLRVINFMWPEGVRLLNRFNDTIYCDSMWSITQDSEYLLTIVVKDNENNIRLAASAIAYGERKQSWITFFAWVKENVPSFNPKCIVTDGATYINSAYVEATRNNPVHLVCWWHKKKTAQGKKGAQRIVEQRILGVAYGQTSEEVEGRFDDSQRSIEASDFDEKTANRLQRILEETTENALIYLRVFTGGTLTNS